MLCPINLDLLLFLFIYLFIYFLIMTVFNNVCVSAFEQGHLDPWRSKSALISIIIIIASRNRNGESRLPWWTPDNMEKDSVKEPLWTTWQVDSS